ncbi:MAG: C39 family peptidase [Candidatus Sericytochromatia bacterium]|nr:C39 family peptidase [Candidatus Tanganyikabacteria bacterium]
MAEKPLIGQLLVAGGFISPEDLERGLARQAVRPGKLGETLVELGAATRMEVDAVLHLQRRPARDARVLLGEILVATCVVSREQLDRALERQKEDARPLGDILVAAGHARPIQISAALAIQRKLVAASLVATLGAASLTGCGTGATLGGVKVFDARSFRTPDGEVALTDNVRGARVNYPGTPVGRMVASAGEHPLARFGDGTVLLENVRFIKQGNVIQGDRSMPDNTCGQAALTMVLRYWQHDSAPSYQQVVDESNRFNLATTQQTMVNFLRSRGLRPQAYKNGTLNHVKAEVDAGRPPIVLLQFSVPHYVVVIGYNEEQGKIVYHDSIDGPYMQLDEAEFRRAWYESDVARMPLVGGSNYVGLTIAVGR